MPREKGRKGVLIARSVSMEDTLCLLPFLLQDSLQTEVSPGRSVSNKRMKHHITWLSLSIKLL